MMTSPEKQVLKSKICCSCNIEKNIDKFYRNSAFKDGYEKRCKVCKKTGKSCRKKTIKKDKSKSGQLRLTNITEVDWIKMYELLEMMGYDLRSEQSIHQQFCLKYNLITKNPYSKKKMKYFSAQELGII